MSAVRKVSPARSAYPARPNLRNNQTEGHPLRQRPGRKLKKQLPKKQKQKQNIEYVHFNTKAYRIPFRVIFTVFLIFAGGVGTAFTFAYLQDMRRQINSTRAAIFAQRSENTATNAELSQHLSIEYIERIAIERLNMGPAEASQIIRINVPRQNYVVQSNAPPRPEPENMWQSAWWHVRNWLGV